MTARRRILPFAYLATTALSLAGCTQTNEVHYFGEKGETQYYLDRATKTDFPVVESEDTPEAVGSLAPRTVMDERKDEIWSLPLSEAVHIGLQNNRVIRTRASFLSEGNALLNGSERAPSIYDPSIQESGVLFGGRGVESALAAFDTQLAAQMNWGRNETATNNLIPGPAAAEIGAETADFGASLTKTFGYGGTLSLSHDVGYLGTAGGGNTLFNSIYAGSVGASYRHPLLAGSGAEFTRIAGPIAGSFGGLTGVSQGVVIARINNDLTITDLEENLTNFVKDVQDQYWELYLNYRLYDTTVTSRNSALRTWRDAKLKRDVGGAPGFTLEDEAQARDRYFETQAQSKLALSRVYQTESGLRRLIGLAVNDGRVIRPADEPISAKYQPDWATSIADGVTRRVELRRQKWQIKSLELQMLAAENLVRPRLDFVSGYQVNGFGDQLLSQGDRDRQGTRQGLNSFYETINQGDHTGWNAGLVFELPLGLRAARAQVRNVELRLTKARDVLAASEIEISHEIANAFQSLAETYTLTQSYVNRRDAALERVRLTEANEKVGKQTIDMVLRAQASLAEAEVAYFRALVSYTQAITNLHFRQGVLLAQNNVFMSESEWSPEAYELALRRARARSAAKDAECHLDTQPAEFVTSDEFSANSMIAIPLPPEVATPPSTPAAVPGASEPDKLPLSVPPAAEPEIKAPKVPDSKGIEPPKLLPAPKDKDDQALMKPANPGGTTLVPPVPAPAPASATQQTSWRATSPGGTTTRVHQ